MRRLGSTAAAALLSLGFTTGAATAHVERICPAPVYFANGILATKQQATRVVEKLAAEIHEELPGLRTDCVRGAFNPSSIEDDGPYQELIDRAVTLISGVGLDLSESVRQWLVDFGRVIFRDYVVPEYSANPVLRGHVQDYRSDLDSHGRVIIVGHSQGNWFASHSFEVLTNGVDGKALIAPERVWIVATSTPTEPSGRNHVTLQGDWIALLPGAPPQNTDPTGARCGFRLPWDISSSLSLDPACHSVVKSYLKKGSHSRNAIIGQIVDAILTAPPAPQPPTAATISVTSNVPAPWVLQPGGHAGIGSGSVIVAAAPGPVGTLYTLLPATIEGHLATVSSPDNGGASMTVSAGETKTFSVVYEPTVPAPSDVRYSITVLEAPVAGRPTAAFAINSSGTVAGAVNAASTIEYTGCGASEATMPALWAPDGGVQVLSPAPLLDIGGATVKPCGGFVNDVNDEGVAVGVLSYGHGGLGGSRAFVWSQDNGMTLIRDAWGEPLLAASANGVNDLGHVVGHTGSNAFRWSVVGGLEYLSIGAQITRALSINDAGSVGGSAGIEACNTEPVIWSVDNTPLRLDLAEALGSVQPVTALCHGRVSRLTNIGEAVGSVDVRGPSNETARRAWIRTTRGIQFLPSLPFGPSFGNVTTDEAHAVSENGEVVGASNGRAFLWSQVFGILDLTALIDDSDGGWLLDVAWGINEYGAVVGEGRLHGQPRSFLLIPAPAKK